MSIPSLYLTLATEEDSGLNSSVTDSWIGLGSFGFCYAEPGRRLEAEKRPGENRLTLRKSSNKDKAGKF